MDIANDLINQIDQEIDYEGLWIWETPEYNYDYILVADGAPGGNISNLAFIVMKAGYHSEVAEYTFNNTNSFNVAALINEIAIYYNNALVVVENKSEGSTILSYLVNVYKYQNLYYEDYADNPGIDTNKKTRPLMLNALKKSLERKSVYIYSERIMDELYTFIRHNNGKIAAMKGKNDDLVMCLAIYCMLFVEEEEQVAGGFVKQKLTTPSDKMTAITTMIDLNTERPEYNEFKNNYLENKNTLNTTNTKTQKINDMIDGLY